MKYWIVLICFFLMGMSEAELRQEQERIQIIIEQSQRANKQPKPLSDPRAARSQRNRYSENKPPVYPKVIYREPLKTKHSRRFFGGIPR